MSLVSLGERVKVEILRYKSKALFFSQSPHPSRITLGWSFQFNIYPVHHPRPFRIRPPTPTLPSVRSRILPSAVLRAKRSNWQKDLRV